MAIPPDPLSSNRILAASLAAVALTAAVFAIWPDLDLTMTSFFARAPGSFVGDTPRGRALRQLFEAAPFAVLGVFALLYGLRRWGRSRLWSPSGAGLTVMVLSLALGPGLLVNGLLKTHSHRPRPVQVTAFGGSDAFRPFYRLDGACDRNCSFVSGEGATAFWTIAPALLVPPPWRPAAVLAAIAIGSATGLLRMAFGGHFLSDTIFAGLFVWLVILGCWRAVASLAGRSPASGAPSRSPDR